jgi:hypothetical protein
MARERTRIEVIATGCVPADDEVEPTLDSVSTTFVFPCHFQRTAIQKDVDILKSGGVCVIDVHIDPGEEGNAAAMTTTRSA